MVLELRPGIPCYDKGKALLWLLERLEMASGTHVPVYIGDDDTDEDAFRAIAGRGVGVRIGDPHEVTAADYTLADVESFLDLPCAPRLGGAVVSSIGQTASGQSGDQWTLVYEGYRPEDEGLREALCAVGNGYFMTRGACAQSSADRVHYPGTYLAGGFNRLVSAVAGRTIENEDLVNLPNWLPLTFRRRWAGVLWR